MDEQQLVALTDPHSPAAEAYRALRINLTYAGLDAPLKTLVVAAPGKEHGPSVATVVAANLAIVMAQTGARVILVDANLRAAQLHTVFSLANEPGLTQAIVALEQALPLRDTSAPTLRLLTSGGMPPNAVDILSARKMDALLEQLAAQADYVILVAPPVVEFVDAAVLGSKTDGVLLAVRSGQTRRDHIAQAKDTLARFDARLRGAVLTDAPG